MTMTIKNNCVSLFTESADPVIQTNKVSEFQFICLHYNDNEEKIKKKRSFET